MTTSEENHERPKVITVPEPREELVKTAVKFLHNPQVKNSPLKQKQAFLTNKGLTAQEVQLACEQAGAFIDEEKRNSAVHFQAPGQYFPPPHTVVPIPPYPLASAQQSLFGRLRDVIQTVLLFSGAAYGLYYLYKATTVAYVVRSCLEGGNSTGNGCTLKLLLTSEGVYSASILWKEKQEKSIEVMVSELDKSVSLSVEELQNSVKQLKATIETQQQEMARLAERDSSTQFTKLIQDVKSEISSVKGLLLSRHQFPTTPKPTPTIPVWQLESKSGQEENQGNVESCREKSDPPSPHSDEGHEGEDMYRSSSSDAVLVSKSDAGGSGSDSSLEMIKD